MIRYENGAIKLWILIISMIISPLIYSILAIYNSRKLNSKVSAAIVLFIIIFFLGFMWMINKFLGHVANILMFWLSSFFLVYIVPDSEKGRAASLTYILVILLTVIYVMGVIFL